MSTQHPYGAQSNQNQKQRRSFIGNVVSVGQGYVNCARDLVAAPSAIGHAASTDQNIQKLDSSVSREWHVWDNVAKVEVPGKRIRLGEVGSDLYERAGEEREIVVRPIILPVVENPCDRRNLNRRAVRHWCRKIERIALNAGRRAVKVDEQGCSGQRAKPRRKLLRAPCCTYSRILVSRRLVRNVERGRLGDCQRAQLGQDAEQAKRGQGAEQDRGIHGRGAYPAARRSWLATSAAWEISRSFCKR